MSNTTLKVLSYNIWGIFTAPEVSGRITRFATPDVAGKYDVILLQEQFDEIHWDMIRAGTSDSHPYTHRFVTSHIGNGLAVLSKYPILDTHFEQYYLQGSPEKLWHGDYYCNKGISLTRIRIPRSAMGGAAGDDSHVVVNFYDTHTVACYQKYSEVPYEIESNSGARMSQLAQAIRFIECTSSAEDNIVFAGDFNCAGPKAPEIKLVRGHYQAKTEGRVLRSVFDGDGRITYTDDNYHNGKSTNHFKLLNMEEDKPVQLDHMLIASEEIKTVSSAVAMKELYYKDKSGRDVPLSDHFGVEASFSVDPSAKDIGESLPTNANVDDVKYAIGFMKRRATLLDTERRRFLMAIAVFLLLLPIVFAYGLHFTAAATGFLVSGFCGAVCFIIGRTQRANDALTLRHQARDLRLVLDPSSHPAEDHKH